MNRHSRLIVLWLFVALTACDPVPLQYPPGSVQYPYPNPNAANLPQAAPSPQVSGSQRWEHTWNKAMEGMVMGGSIGGLYGAGGGLVIGLITGLATAESYYGQINSQIQGEQQKDQQLEAAIDKELERQRALENQIAQATTPSSGAPADQPLPDTQSQPAPPPPQKNGQTIPQRRDATALASLSQPATPAMSAPPFKNMEVKDLNGDGIPDQWVYYNPQKPGEVMRQEEATKGNSRVDTWSYFKDGKLVRREVDTKGQGRPDIIYYYAGDKIAREERDEAGEGRMTYRATYQNGRLAKVEKDSTHQGRPDLWIYYDLSKEGDIVLKEERDLNSDGSADLWTYFDAGRVVRRDVNAVGLELLSKQERLPAAGEDLGQVSTSGR